MKHKWLKWTFLEALMKTISKIFQKTIGTISTGFRDVVLGAMIIGAVQTVVGFIMAVSRKKNLLTNKRDILGSCSFGFNAFLSTIIPFYVFLLGGDMGINTFIITMSIIPGAIIDWIFFKNKLNKIQWFGISVVIFAGYSILEWPPISQLLEMPLWIWLSMVNMLLVAINQGITQKIKGIDPFIKNFWGGATTLVMSLVFLLFMGSINIIFDPSKSSIKLYESSFILGFIIIAMWCFNLFGYKDGAKIALKKAAMNGSYLTMSIFAGVIFFKEALTLGKMVGILLFFIGFLLIDATKKTK